MQSSQKIPLINSLRGVAILAVIYHHLFGHITVPGWHATGVLGLPLFPFTLLSNGLHGVALFFLLSGFVLYLPYVSGRKTMKTWSDAKAFYRRRFLRLYPLFAVAVIVGMIFIRPDQNIAEWLRNATLMFTGTFVFTQDLFMPPYNWVLWTLGVEIWFSVLFPPLVLLSRNVGIARLATTMLILCLAYRLIFVAMGGDPQFGLINSIAGRLDDFVVGMLMAHWYTHWKNRSIPYAIPLGIVSLYIGFVLQDFLRLRLIPPPVAMLLNVFIIGGFFLIVLRLLQRTNAARRSMWPLRCIQMIGIACYSIYIWHAVLIAPTGALYSTAGLAYYVVCVSAVSYLSYQLIEKGGKDLGFVRM